MFRLNKFIYIMTYTEILQFNEFQLRKNDFDRLNLY